MEAPARSLSTISLADAQRAASDYIIKHLDPSFVAASGESYYSKTLGREVWQFVLRCEQGPLATIAVDAQTGEVVALTNDEIRAVRERAIIFIAKEQGVLPVDEQGYVLAEYARRQADSYLGAEVSLFYSTTNGVFVPLACPIWQFAIQVRLPRLGVLGIMGTLDVDAQTGEVIPLTHKQIKRIRERADALVEFRTQTATA
jgi:hypothetical protein